LDIKMELLLAQAVEKGEFILHYQPQFKALTNELYGFEALIRWNSPELGFVSPGDFIPLAEETGEIMRIGEWVIEQACLQHVEWKTQGFSPIPISINLSIRQFYQNDFVIRVRSIVQKTGIDPSFIMFEITETIAMQEEVAFEVLNKLKEIGFKVAMDDFGTGYSSLKYIQTFAMDHLKIDRAFIDKIGTKKGKAIVATIISLGHHLDMKIVAEGVETAIQVQVLEEMKCDFFQGYYFGKPLPVHGVEAQYLTLKVND
jgi:EAL domain-containing protein (putative c-di-GMP-specific phosphodiesterase class I)